MSPNSDSVIDVCQGNLVEMDLLKELSYVRPSAAKLLADIPFQNQNYFHLFVLINVNLKSSLLLFLHLFSPF